MTATPEIEAAIMREERTKDLMQTVADAHVSHVQLQVQAVGGVVSSLAFSIAKHVDRMLGKMTVDDMQDFIREDNRHREEMARIAAGHEVGV